MLKHIPIYSYGEDGLLVEWNAEELILTKMTFCKVILTGTLALYFQFSLSWGHFLGVQIEVLVC